MNYTNRKNKVFKRTKYKVEYIERGILFGLIKWNEKLKPTVIGSDIIVEVMKPQSVDKVTIIEWDKNLDDFKKTTFKL